MKLPFIAAALVAIAASVVAQPSWPHSSLELPPLQPDNPRPNPVLGTLEPHPQPPVQPPRAQYHGGGQMWGHKVLGQISHPNQPRVPGGQPHPGQQPVQHPAYPQQYHPNQPSDHQGPPPAHPGRSYPQPPPAQIYQPPAPPHQANIRRWNSPLVQRAHPPSALPPGWTPHDGHREVVRLYDLAMEARRKLSLTGDHKEHHRKVYEGVAKRRLEHEMVVTGTSLAWADFAIADALQNARKAKNAADDALSRQSPEAREARRERRRDNKRKLRAGLH